MALTKAHNRMIEGASVNVKDYGAVGDDTTDDTSAIQAAATYCTSNGKTLFIPSGIYKITSAIDAGCSIEGDSPNDSIIKNYGTGDALNLSAGGYYESYSDFSVDGSGNANSQDGISLYDGSGNNSYSSFHNVYSHNNGRHGIYHRYAWGTRYSQCKFYSNGGLGIYLNMVSGDAGGANAITFLDCDSRHNGGSTSTDTYADDKGGVKIEGCAAVNFFGGVYESNHAWGFIIGSATDATRNININGIYTELNGEDATSGGFLYVGENTANVSVTNCWLAHTAGSGKTNYLVYIDDATYSTASGIRLENNFTYGFGSGTNVTYTGKHKQKSERLVSNLVGDVGGSGVANTYDVATVSNDGSWMISGTVNISRTGTTNQHGVYPFLAKRDNAGSRSVEVGSSLISAVSSAPTMSWNGNDLEVTFPAYEYGTVTLDEQVSSAPTTLTMGSTLFPNVLMRRK